MHICSRRHALPSGCSTLHRHPSPPMATQAVHYILMVGLQEQIQAIRAMAATPEDQAVIDQLLDNAKALARSRPPLLQQPAKAYPPNLPSPLEVRGRRAKCAHTDSPALKLMPALFACQRPCTARKTSVDPGIH